MNFTQPILGIDWIGRYFQNQISVNQTQGGQKENASENNRLVPLGVQKLPISHVSIIAYFAASPRSAAPQILNLASNKCTHCLVGMKYTLWETSSTENAETHHGRLCCLSLHLLHTVMGRMNMLVTISLIILRVQNHPTDRSGHPNTHIVVDFVMHCRLNYSMIPAIR